MSALPLSVRMRTDWNAARILKLMLAAQCLLALFVVVGDLPTDVMRSFPGAEPRAPTTEVPVTPGNQTRRFEPGRLPTDQPTGPDFPSEEFVSPRLEFSTIQIGGRADTVLLSGSIAEGDALRFDAWLKTLSVPPGAFALHSPGGAVDQALEIGRMIRATGAPVVIAPGAACYSACPYVLAGGTTREVSRRGLVGVHQHYFGENTYLPAFLLVSDIQVGQGEVMAYLNEMGIDPMVMAKGLMTRPDDIYILMPEELEGFRLSTVLTE